MSAVSTVHESAQDGPQHVDLAKFGMLVFLASEAMLFAGLISAYLILWISRGHEYRPEWVDHSWPILMTGINTIILLSSSGTLWFGEQDVAKGRNPGKWLALTTLLGAIFVSVQCREWLELRSESLWWGTAGTYSSCFFALTGFHGLHVSIGVVFLAITTLMAAAGKYTPHRHSFLTCVSLYWHFVDVVWVLLFTVMYILPSFVH